MPVPQDKREFVLAATLNRTAGGQPQGRLFDELVLERRARAAVAISRRAPSAPAARAASDNVGIPPPR